MAIIVTDASRLIVKNQRNSEDELRKENQRLRDHANQQYAGRDGETRLYVNGKERRIGKKSQYLLDMLTLED
jgi:hypothetical protein